MSLSTVAIRLIWFRLNTAPPFVSSPVIYSTNGMDNDALHNILPKRTIRSYHIEQLQRGCDTRPAAGSPPRITLCRCHTHSKQSIKMSFSVVTKSFPFFFFNVVNNKYSDSQRQSKRSILLCAYCVWLSCDRMIRKIQRSFEFNYSKWYLLLILVVDSGRGGKT